MQVALYQSVEDREAQAKAIPYTAPQLMEYISYARAHCSPAITEEVRVLRHVSFMVSCVMCVVAACEQLCTVTHTCTRACVSTLSDDSQQNLCPCHVCFGCAHRAALS